MTKNEFIAHLTNKGIDVQFQDNNKTYLSYNGLGLTTYFWERGYNHHVEHDQFNYDEENADGLGSVFERLSNFVLHGKVA